MTVADMSERLRGATFDGLVHVTRTRTDTWSLCGTPTDRQVTSRRGAPCSTCLARAADEIADAEEATT